MAQTQADILSRHIEPDPFHTGPGDVRLVGSGVAVWAIVGHLAATGCDLAQTAVDYAIPVDEVEAALAYYRRFKPFIDARLADNSTGSFPVPIHAAL